MSASAYRDHPVRGSVSRILEMQSAPEFADPSVSDNETYAFARDKVFALTHAIHALLRATPAELTSNHALNQINAHLQSAVSELSAFQANKNPGHINNAAAQLEQNALPFLWGFVPQAQQLSPNSLGTLLEAQASVSRESVRQLVVQRDDLAAKLADLATKADAQAARLEALAEGAAKERAEAAATVAKLEQVFAQKETERSSAFDAALGELRKDFTTFDTTVRADSATLLDAIEDQRVQAARIVQVVGNIGVTGNYQQIANAEAEQANFWRWATIVFFAAGIAVATATFIKFWGQPFSSETALSVVIRLLYAIAITAPAWYTARESARHRTTSDRARQTELELASIGPFIELLPEEKKVQIREQLTPHYFGKSVEVHTASNPLDAAAVKDMAVELAKVLKK
jgi:hypothetical protein